MELKEFWDSPLITKGDFIEMVFIVVSAMLITIPLRWIMKWRMDAKDEEVHEWP